MTVVEPTVKVNIIYESVENNLLKSMSTSNRKLNIHNYRNEVMREGLEWIHVLHFSK